MHAPTCDALFESPLRAFLEISLAIPVHFRYQEPSASENHEEYARHTLAAPELFVQCEDASALLVLAEGKWLLLTIPNNNELRREVDTHKDGRQPGG